MLNKLQPFMVFSLVGTLGFALDTCILYILLDVTGAYVGRAISFSCSVFFTWQLNRRFTFNNRTSNKGSVAELAQYFSLMLLGGIANLGVYALLTSEFLTVAQLPALGVAAGSLAGLFINFLSSRYLLFSRSVYD